MDEDGYLLDSHILIWSLYQQNKLPDRHRTILEGGGSTWISAATVWEVEIKKHAGRLPLPDSIWDQAMAVGHRFLDITPVHSRQAASLPLHHGDPFDRMLIAQAMAENLTILSVDQHFTRYAAKLI